MLGVVRLGLMARTTAPDPVVPLLKSAAAGCDAAGTPEVEMELSHWCETAVRDCTPPSVDEVGFGSCAPLSVPLSRVAGTVPDWRVPVTSTVHRSVELAKLRKRSKFPVGD